MSYLPLCFPGIQILDIWVAISVAGTVYFPSLESGKWSGLPRTPGTVSAVGKRDSGLRWAAKTGVGVGDEVEWSPCSLLWGERYRVAVRSVRARMLHAPSISWPVWPLRLSSNSEKAPLLACLCLST